MPGAIAFRLDDLIVQQPPAWPEYCEQSFVTWRSPLRGDAEPATANAPATTLARSNPRVALMLVITSSFGCRRSWALAGPRLPRSGLLADRPARTRPRRARRNRLRPGA